MRNTSYNDYFSDELKDVFNEIRSGRLGDPNEFNGLLDTICHNNDFYLVGTDFNHYKETQERAEKTFMNKQRWNAMSIRTAIRMAKFSSDRTIRQYAENIWLVYKEGGVN